MSYDSVYIRRLADRLVADYNTNNPFELARLLNVEVRFKELGTLKGFYTLQRRIPFIVINKDLDERTAEIVCAHELGHDRLHRRFARFHILDEMELYLIDTKIETEANIFASQLLIPDQRLFEIKRQSEGRLTIGETASALDTTPELLTIKLGLHQTAQRG